MPAAFRAAILGVFAGAVSGLFGVGGGVIVVPGLVLLLGFDQRRAAATSLATIVVSAGAALVLFGAESAVDWAAAGLLLIGALIGAWAGTRVIERIPAVVITWVFASLMLVAAGRLAFP